MSKGGSNTSTTVQDNSPWGPAQPALEQILGGASSAYNSGQGFAPYPGSTVAPFSSQTNQALTGIANTANAGNPLGTASQNAALGVLNSGGQTPGMSAAASGYQGLLGANSTPNAVANDLSGYANGSYVNGGSPQFLQALDAQSGKLTDDINRTYSNDGRYGSTAQTNDIIDQVGNLRDSAIANQIQQQQGNQIQAAGMLSGEQQTGIANQTGLLGSIGSLGQQGANNLATFSGLAPSIYSQQYAPYTELAGAGNAYDTQNQNQLTGQVNQFNTQQQQPWNLLNAYMSAITGASGNSGTQSSTATTPQPSPLQGLLSGGLLGGQLGSMFGPIGTGIGALGGGILGAL